MMPLEAAWVPWEGAPEPCALGVLVERGGLEEDRLPRGLPVVRLENGEGLRHRLQARLRVLDVLQVHGLLLTPDLRRHLEGLLVVCDAFLELVDLGLKLVLLDLELVDLGVQLLHVGDAVVTVRLRLAKLRVTEALLGRLGCRLPNETLDELLDKLLHLRE